MDLLSVFEEASPRDACEEKELFIDFIADVFCEIEQEHCQSEIEGRGGMELHLAALSHQ
jgi:hypothetical protein